MAKNWNTCPRCGRPYQSVTNLPCGIGDCKTMGQSGDPTKHTPKGRTGETTQGDGSGYVEHRSGCLTSIVTTIALAAGELVWAIGTLVSHVV